MAHLGHHHSIGASAAVLGAAEPQVLQRHVAATSVHNRLQGGWRLVLIRLAPEEVAAGA